MSAILIANDANSWFESGYVKNVTVKNNRFIDCGSPVINIHPENTEIVEGEFVHRNINIANNHFQLNEEPLIKAKSTSTILFTYNAIKISRKATIEELLHFEACEDVNVENNTIYNP